MAKYISYLHHRPENALKRANGEAFFMIALSYCFELRVIVRGWVGGYGEFGLRLSMLQLEHLLMHGGE